ncbi:hypothetical protein F4808DRAFT_460934 [Astrocystis sublimbata]|nr:hypothetical protein F4808DRAFT_460934 [Astrocystis sublimbata]
MALEVEGSYLPKLLPYFQPDGSLQANVNLCAECDICKLKLAITQPADKEHESFTNTKPVATLSRCMNSKGDPSSIFTETPPRCWTNTTNHPVSVMIAAVGFDGAILMVRIALLALLGRRYVQIHAVLVSEIHSHPADSYTANRRSRSSPP